LISSVGSNKVQKILELPKLQMLGRNVLAANNEWLTKGSKMWIWLGFIRKKTVWLSREVIHSSRWR